MTDQLALDELRRVEVADVWKGERRVARLARDGNDVLFAYLSDYLTDPDDAVAHTLPVTSEVIRTPAGALPAFFAGLLPEGLRLRAVVVGTTTSEDDHLTLLLAVGGDTIGDVRVVPADATPPEIVVSVTEGSIPEERLTEVFARAISPEPLDLERIALPGVQPKVSAAMVSAPVRTPTGAAILKLNPDRGYPRLVENESFFLTMAADCGLDVPDHRLVHDKDGHSGLLVSRFDRVTESGVVRRLAQEDACQLLGAYPAAKYRLKTEDIARRMARAAEEGGGSFPVALRRVLQLVAFSYLIGNGDLHAKNFSVRRGPDEIWGVSPAYDLVSTQPYLGWRDPMALNLYGRGNRLDRNHFLEAGVRLGLPARVIVRMLDLLVGQAEPWIDRTERIGLRDKETELLQNLIRRRLDELSA